MKISIVIPCYNSSNTIEKVVTDIKSVLKSLGIINYEIILVNDCSNDNTFEKIREIASMDSDILGINLAHNSGQHNAIMAGMNYTSGDYVMVCSDDGQSPIEALNEMIKQLDQGKDAVCIKYEQRKQRNFFRQLGTYADALVAEWLIEQPKEIDFSIDFIAKRFVIDELLRYKGPYCYISGLLFRTTKNIGNILAVQKDRKSGKSGYTLKKLLKLWLNGFTAFSVKPLRISAFVGCVFAFSGFIMTLFILLRKLLGIPVQAGWSSIIIILLITGGLIMIMLGLIGEYLGRIYMCLNNSPQYVIKETVNTQK